jgi:hypothetical protein
MGYFPVRLAANILVTHSQSGTLGWRTAIVSKNVRAIVSYEPGGDYSSPRDGRPLWPWIDAVNQQGGDVTLIELPSIGIRGNTHFLMSDLNNVGIANHLSAFLRNKGLD